MAMKDELKTVLLLSPQRMLEDHQVLESLHIVKNAKGTTFLNKELDAAEIRNNYEKLPKPARELLIQFSKAGVSNIIGQIKQRYTIKRAGVAFEPFFRTAMLRELHSVLEHSNHSPYWQNGSIRSRQKKAVTEQVPACSASTNHNCSLKW